MSDRLALPRRYRDQLEALLRQHVPGVEVWAYGSRVNGESHEGSDLDLVLRGPGLEPLDGGFYDLLEAIEKSDIPILVQAHDWAMLPESFHREIEWDYVVVQKGSSEDSKDLTGQWREMTLGDVCTKIGSGATPRGGRDVYVQDGPYTLIRSQNVYNDGFHRDGLVFIGDNHAGELKNVEVFEEDVLLNITGDSVARVCQVASDVLPARVNQHVAIIRPDSFNLDPGYLRYFLVSPEMQTMLLSWAGSGGTRNALTKGIIESLEISLPPLPEQRAIAGLLGTLDDKIELNRRMNETLEAMARALFKSWFVDFEPVRAKMEGWWRRGESLPGLPADLYELFPDRLVDSVLGEIPEGWEVRALGTLLDDVIGGDWGKETPDVDHTEPVSIIRGTDLPALAEGGSGSVPLRFTTKKKAERRMLKDGDIIIEVSGGSPTQSTGRSLMMTQDVLRRFPGTVVCASFCRRFRPNSWRDGLLVSRHLDFLHSTGKMWDYQLQSTGIANFQTTRFLKEEMAIWPGEPLLTTFAEIVGPIVRQTSRNENMILAAQRETLVPKLVSGELRVALG